MQERFEFDERKSKANEAKHDIDFVAAQALWLDDNLLRIAARTAEEQRFLVIGMIADKHWSAVITYRQETIRLISVRRSRAGRCRRMKASEFDRKFDEGVEDVIDDLDMATATRPLKEQRRVNVDFPSWMVESLDREARRLGVTRQSIIKVWIAERLEKAS
jgi:Uncharacterized protein conserved in bacteria